jgi:hypothetical protein
VSCSYPQDNIFFYIFYPSNEYVVNIVPGYCWGYTCGQDYQGSSEREEATKKCVLGFSGDFRVLWKLFSGALIVWGLRESHLELRET